MLGTGSVETSEELAVLTRNGFVESRHAGSVVVVSPEGKVLLSKGDPDALIFPRSTMKFFQAIGLLSLGLDLEDEYLALSAGSHNGSAAHLQLVRDVLERAGLTEDDLRGGSDIPADAQMRAEFYSSKSKPHPIYHCCSGKHAAMLLLCQQQGWPIESYLEPQHPVQQRIREVVEYLTESNIPVTGTDGCGTPVYAMPLTALATGISHILTASNDDPYDLKENGNKLIDAMMAHPWVVGAPGEPDTLIMEDLGIVAKTGYEGVFITATREGVVAATKILDGNLRVAHAVTLTALVRVGILRQKDVDKVLAQCHMDVYGGGKVVGELSASF